jgi:D-amino-acid dehydrogenase
MGRTKVGKLWVNAGHGTLGWTHGAGSGKALAELIHGEQPAMAFDFYGMKPQTQAPMARTARLQTPPPSQA